MLKAEFFKEGHSVLNPDVKRLCLTRPSRFVLFRFYIKSAVRWRHALDDDRWVRHLSTGFCIELEGIDPQHFLVILYNMVAPIEAAGLGGGAAARDVLL